MSTGLTAPLLARQTAANGGNSQACPEEVNAEEIVVELVPLPVHGELAPEWRALEEHSDGSFFVSWSWISCWIQSIEDIVDLRLLRAKLHGRSVGLAIFANHMERRHRIIRSRTLRLHATGQPALDSITVECNGFLVDRGMSELVVQRMLRHVLERERCWDELVLDGLWSTPGWPFSDWQLRAAVTQHANHYVDLDAVRAHSGGYLALLGSKTRSRIRRSCREYEQLGQVRIELPGDVQQALEFLEGMKVLHQKYWVARGEPGSFANAFFERFHRRLVQDAFGRGEIQLLAIDVGAHRLGYIYNFLYRGRVYNYQSGLDYHLRENQNRPGLVAHTLAIEHSARTGQRVYDFLGGDVEYKQALGTGVATMAWVVVQRDRLRFKVEAAGRALRNRMSQVRSRNVSSSTGAEAKK